MLEIPLCAEKDRLPVLTMVARLLNSAALALLVVSMFPPGGGLCFVTDDEYDSAMHADTK